MIKYIITLMSLQIIATASEQVVLVVSDNFTSSKASLECYEDGKKIFDTIDVSVGKNGLGWGIGEIHLSTRSNQPIKYEGDKKAPAGIFKLTNLYGYSPQHDYKMPYLYASKSLICVDDSSSNFYNQIIESNGDERSFENMKRKDHQYELGIVVEHNKKALDKRGSCIFLHVKKSQNSATAGCTAMNLEEIQKIASWLDIKKNPILIQIPKSSSKEILRLFPMLRESQLLK